MLYKKGNTVPLKDGTNGVRFSGYEILGYKIAGLYRKRERAYRLKYRQSRFNPEKKIAEVQPRFQMVTGATFRQFHMGKRTLALELRVPTYMRHLHNFAKHLPSTN